MLAEGGISMRYRWMVFSFVLFVFQMMGGETHLLSIGVEPKLTRQNKMDLYARDAEHVANAFKSAALSQLRFKSQLINGKEASRKKVITSLKALSERVGDDDLTIIFFSTHGEIDKNRGYYFVLAPESPKQKESYLYASDFHQQLAKISGDVLVLADTCRAEGLLTDSEEGHASFIVASKREESSYGQEYDEELPHGYFVLSLCEALGGLGDSDRNRKLSVGELSEYISHRTAFMCKEQTAVSHLIPSQRRQKLGKTPAKESLYLRTIRKGARNPFGYKDIEEPFDSSVKKYIQEIKQRSERRDPNAEEWAESSEKKWSSYEGEWACRWKEGDGRWNGGRAWFSTTEKTTFVIYTDGSNEYLMELRQISGNRLVGKYENIHDSSDSGPWLGHLRSKERIDGFWPGGRWDLRR